MVKGMTTPLYDKIKQTGLNTIQRGASALGLTFDYHKPKDASDKQGVDIGRRPGGVGLLGNGAVRALGGLLTGNIGGTLKGLDKLSGGNLSGIAKLGVDALGPDKPKVPVGSPGILSSGTEFAKQQQLEILNLRNAERQLAATERGNGLLEAIRDRVGQARQAATRAFLE